MENGQERKESTDIGMAEKRCDGAERNCRRSVISNLQTMESFSMIPDSSSANLSHWLSWKAWNEKAKQEINSGKKKRGMPWQLLVIAFLLGMLVVAKVSKANETRY